MHEQDEEPGGWGLAASLKLLAAIMLLIVASAAIGLVLGMSLQTFKMLVVDTLLIGGIIAVTSLLLGLLIRK